MRERHHSPPSSSHPLHHWRGSPEARTASRMAGVGSLCPRATPCSRSRRVRCTATSTCGGLWMWLCKGWHPAGLGVRGAPVESHFRGWCGEHGGSGSWIARQRSAFGCQPSCGGGGQFLCAELDQAAGRLSASLVEEVGKHWRKPCRICRRDDRDAYGCCLPPWRCRHGVFCNEHGLI